MSPGRKEALMEHGHSIDCARAVRTTPRECECTCNGAFHGGPHTGRVRALVWEKDKRKTYSGRRVTAAKNKARKAIDADRQKADATGREGRRDPQVGRACTDFAVTHAIDLLILSGSTDEEDRAHEVIEALVVPFVDEIVAAGLDETEDSQIKTAVDELHVVCEVCVAVLQLIAEGKDLAGEVAEEAAQSVVTALQANTVLSTVVQDVLRRALTASLTAVIDLASDSINEKLFQLVGFVTCPDVSQHTEVQTYCVDPLVTEWVATAMHRWINSKFREGSTVFLPESPKSRQ